MNKGRFIFIGIMTLTIWGGNSAFAQIKIGGKNIDAGKVLQAGSEVAKAVTLTDADVATMSKMAVAQMDTQNKIADTTSAYAKRLTKLTKGIKDANGTPYNFKVYITPDINAFATGDGSIRIYSGLMDIMSDEELMAIIGHEIGHVVHSDAKDAMKTAYLTSAALSAAGVAGGTVAKLSQSQLGALVNAFTNATFSRTQENAADDYGYDFAIKQGYSPYAMSNALNKLVTHSQGAKASFVQKMFASHPDSAKRALRMKAKADTVKFN